MILIYWYGECWSVSFVQNASVKSVDSGMKMGIDRLPKSIANK